MIDIPTLGSLGYIFMIKENKMNQLVILITLISSALQFFISFYRYMTFNVTKEQILYDTNMKGNIILFMCFKIQSEINSIQITFLYGLHPEE